MHFGKSLVCLVIGVLLLRSSKEAQSIQDYKYLYKRAEKLSIAENHTDQTDEAALRSYLEVINILTRSQKDDPFLFKAYVSTGTFLQVLTRNRESVSYLKNALLLKKRLPHLDDSVLFRPLVYCGNAYYTLDVPDTAESYYREAEVIAEKYPQINELERLYNTLGVISSSKGNYSESIPYYEKAISTLEKHSSVNEALLVVYKNNLASALKKLKSYDQALKIYQAILPYKIETDKLNHNIGSVYLAMGKNDDAIYYLQKVNYEDQKKLNDLGLAYFKKGNYNKAIFYLDKSMDLSRNINKNRKNRDCGITLKYLGDVWLKKNQIGKALSFYQQSINNLLLDFNSTDVYSNPSNFNNAFNAIELLETLSAKAISFNILFSETGKLPDLKASLKTYLAFYKLANYIQRFYETDESRLLISDKKYFSHQQPINICITLFRLTGDKKFIETAFSLDEENKAGVLSLYLEESDIKRRVGLPEKLLKKELDLKQNITRIALKASFESDSLRLFKYKELINEYTIALLNVQQKISKKTGFNISGTSSKKIELSDLQRIIPTGSAILSYHIGDTDIVCFIITDNSFDFFTEKIDKAFIAAVNETSKAAQFTDRNNAKQIKNLGRVLYKKLISPADALIKGKEDLMIIPNDELNFLPFELLVDNDGNSLLSKFSITYNYSCLLLQGGSGGIEVAGMKKLGMAPFNNRISKSGAASSWSELPASGQEIQMPNGTSLINQKATKHAFLEQAHNFNIIHLATHAYTNDIHPDQSYIVFYPTIPDSAINYKLYLPEIYNLRLDKTRLIILSACESGVGELVKGEGLMSLSRAFSYSGCDDIITSMWKADDASTAYISGRLHLYLQKGLTVAEALRKSKLDYLEDSNISSSKKLAGFWAHLRLTGNFEKPTVKYPWGLSLAIFVLICFVITFFIKKKAP